MILNKFKYILLALFQQTPKCECIDILKVSQCRSSVFQRYGFCWFAFSFHFPAAACFLLREGFILIIYIDINIYIIHKVKDRLNKTKKIMKKWLKTTNITNCFPSEGLEIWSRKRKRTVSIEMLIYASNPGGRPNWAAASHICFRVSLSYWFIVTDMHM